MPDMNNEVRAVKSQGHLGHMLPDKIGDRYCINVCSVAGQDKDWEYVASPKIVPEKDEKDKKK